MKAGIAITVVAALAAMEGLGTPVKAQDRKFNETVTVQGAVRGGLGDYAVTFSAPVALPGLSLGRGTYLFRRPAPQVIQVANAAGVADSMFITIPPPRDRADDGYSIVLGAPAAPGSPRRIVAMFAPGETMGEAFVYPHR
jgi:hypothetical protein